MYHRKTTFYTKKDLVSTLSIFIDSWASSYNWELSIDGPGGGGATRFCSRLGEVWVASSLQIALVSVKWDKINRNSSCYLEETFDFF